MNRTVQTVVVAVIVIALVGAGALGAAYLLFGDDSGDSSGESQGPRPTAASTTPAPDATEPPSPELEPYYSQQVEWEPCGDNQCGFLTVPVDYRDAGGATIEVNLLKVPAANPDARIGSLVVNPGGPGAPGTTYAEGADTAFRAPITDRYDIVGFDPRGTGDSAPIDCLPDDEMTDFLAVDPDPDDAGEEQVLVDELADFYQGCADSSAPLVAHVTTAETARDMDVLRAALGESTLSYFGASYGTKLGATYAELFPDKVGRLVLDGAVDVGLSSRDLTLGQAGGFET
ncbi:MAG: alpha/beta hydrolase, partial [Nocardioides sp.]